MAGCSGSTLAARRWHWLRPTEPPRSRSTCDVCRRATTTDFEATSTCGSSATFSGRVHGSRRSSSTSLLRGIRRCRRLPDLLGQVLPGQTEAREILPQAVRVVGGRAARARRREEPPPGFRQAARLSTHRQCVLELRLLETIELRD